MSKLTAAARGMPCQIRAGGVCVDATHETVVLAHYRLAGLCGTGIKPHAILGSHACAACHDLVDFRVPSKVYSRMEIRLMHLEGVMRTIDSLILKGLVTFK